MNLKQFAEKETERLNAESKKFREENDLPGFWVAPKGESRITILQNEPREKDFGDGLRIIFHIQIGEEKKDWALNPRNPVYSEIVKRISGGQEKFVLLRTGEGKQTRYEILEKE